VALFLLVLLIILAFTGVLWFIVKVAVGVALGIFLALMVVAAIVGWRVRRAFRRMADGQGGRRSRSRVTIIRRDGGGL
jgi:membrane protein implicated in regulation of membrane protease activity